MKNFKEGDMVFVSNPDTAFEEEYGKRIHQNFFGTVTEVSKCKPYDCVVVKFENDNEWAYNSNELSSAEDLKDLTLEEFSNTYMVCVNATYL